MLLLKEENTYFPVFSCLIYSFFETAYWAVVSGSWKMISSVNNF